MPEIRLRPMALEEYDAYLGWVVGDYANELVRNGRASAETAMTRAQESFDTLLPDGLGSAGQVLLIAEDAGDGRRVGHLWFGPSGDDASRAWVYDVTVDEADRGRGYGRAIMRAFEDQARERGYARVGLNVFGDNEIARRLYESLGYGEVARQMTKDLDPAG
jgi:ribosomal protein S18 acetylase RimI-like enzyme